jgi:hypothetical protein
VNSLIPITLSVTELFILQSSPNAPSSRQLSIGPGLSTSIHSYQRSDPILWEHHAISFVILNCVLKVRMFSSAGIEVVRLVVSVTL